MAAPGTLTHVLEVAAQLQAAAAAHAASLSESAAAVSVDLADTAAPPSKM